MKIKHSSGTLNLAGYSVKWSTEENHLEIYDKAHNKEVFIGSYEAFCAENGVDFNVAGVITKEIEKSFDLANKV